MSTKINVRSPFYLNLSAPTIPTPEFACSTAFPRGLDDTGFAVDNQGIITEPSPDFGVFVSLTSTDSGFSNNKYATVSTDTTRTITAKTRIPAGFSNAADVDKDCVLTTIQPGTSSSVVQPTVCSGGPATSGSISAVALDTGGNSTTIDLSTKFTGETTYAISNPNTSLVSTALSGSTLTISSNTLGGSVTLYAIGRDASYPTTCEAVQSIAVTISLPAGSPAYDCNTSPLTGGGIAADGTLTNPTTTGTITATTPSTSANTTGSARDVTITFTITVPAGYSNAGASITCPKTYSQPAQNVDPTLDCTIANLTGQSISKNGSINKGNISVGTIASFSPIGFDPVTADTNRTITFTITIPSGYTSAGSTITCSKTLKQPATVGQCGANEYFISAGKNSASDFCDNTYTTSQTITSTGAGITGLMGTKICRTGTPFDGKNLRYAVNSFSTSSGAGVGVGDFYIIQIDGNGTVLSVEIHSCKSGGGGKGSQIL
tara:strand:+ start:738 stop:2207 length:1470 start_codon:yes stop_codon:yes gene_type:complete